MTTNEEFLKAIFGDEYGNAHVTCFADDPDNLGSNHMIAWAGSRYDSYYMQPGNQYFTISLFHPCDDGKYRRRKANFKSCHCVVLDDVKEKLALSQAKKLPQPSWILETSAGSEQWGYILNTPCTDRHKIENLLDGLVSNGLAPGGKDPGMKGVTRYVRLPEGFNNKSRKCVDGIPFKCRLVEWRPDRRCSISELAAPFYVDINAPRYEQRIDGAGLVPDHPLLQHPDTLVIREMRSNGRYEVRCPWVDEHTGAADNGAGIFTNKDGSLGFKCHHGACENRTGKHLMDYMESKLPGFRVNYNKWQMLRSFSSIPGEEKSDGYDEVLSKVQRAMPGVEQNKLAKMALEFIEETMSTEEKIIRHKEIRTVCGWSEKELNAVIKQARLDIKKRKNNGDIDFFSDVIYVAEQNQFFDRRKRLWLTTDAYQNKYSHLDDNAKKSALSGGRVIKVDKTDYAPKMPPIYEDETGATIGNAWHRGDEKEGAEGDCSIWLDHFNKLGWGEYRDHILKWMAYTIRFPEEKINHAIVLGGLEGSGKDFLLRPLVVAMGCNHRTISGEELLTGFNEYIMSTKYLHINEVELGNRQEAVAVSNKLKPLAAAPPEKLRMNRKGVNVIEIRNIVNVSMTTNSKLPIRLNGQSRRFFALWSDLNIRDARGEMLQEWREYWRKAWPWMDNGGVEACIWYLRNVVDLSEFYPREAPPMTDFLEEIVKSSTFCANDESKPSNVVSFL
jgi:hypothetical protein